MIFFESDLNLTVLAEAKVGNHRVFQCEYKRRGVGEKASNEADLVLPSAVGEASHLTSTMKHSRFESHSVSAAGAENCCKEIAGRSKDINHILGAIAKHLMGVHVRAIVN